MKNFNTNSANKSAKYFIIFLLFIELFWLFMSRTFVGYDYVFYTRAPFSLLHFTIYLGYLIVMSSFAMAVVKYVPTIKPIVIGGFAIKIILIISALVNLAKVLLIPESARYTGQLTGLNGLFYFLGFSSFLASTLLAARMVKNGKRHFSLIYTCLVIIYALGIDGFASALTVVSAVYIVYIHGSLNAARLLVLQAIILALFYVGLTSKYTDLPDYLTLEYFMEWLISRLSIQSEQLYAFITGNMSIKSFVDAFELIYRSISLRSDVLFFDDYNPKYPRSVSESIHYDMKGEYFSGSSPGLPLGLLLIGPLTFFILPLLVLFFKQYFAFSLHKNSLPEFVFLSFLLKGVYTDLTEYFTLISPTLLYFVVAFAALILLPKGVLEYKLTHALPLK